MSETAWLRLGRITKELHRQTGRSAPQLTALHGSVRSVCSV